MEFSGKVALVTGAGSGLGEATARALAAAGARLAILDRRQDRLDALATALGAGTIALAADVADETQMRTALDRLIAAAGRLDIVVVNAGINGMWAPIDEITPAEWDTTVAANLRGSYLTLHLTVPHLKRAGGGAIVIVSSINGTRTFSTGGASAYTATKAAQAALSNQLALELGKHRIRVNTVAPGSTRTSISESTARRNQLEALVPAIFPEGEIPLTGGRIASAADVADAIVMLCSDRARHVTGTWLYVDGGQSLLR